MLCLLASFFCKGFPIVERMFKLKYISKRNMYIYIYILMYLFTCLFSTTTGGVAWCAVLCPAALCCPMLCFAARYSQIPHTATTPPNPLVRAEASVDAGALDADEHPEVHRGPGRRPWVGSARGEGTGRQGIRPHQQIGVVWTGTTRAGHSSE